jgi:hypothetical protein
MNIQELARRREVQILVAFGVVSIAGYYFWLKKQKDALKWANASGKNTLLTSKTATTDPIYKECAKRCEGSSTYNECMYKCIDKNIQTGF